MIVLFLVLSGIVVERSGVIQGFLFDYLLLIQLSLAGNCCISSNIFGFKRQACIHNLGAIWRMGVELKCGINKWLSVARMIVRLRRNWRGTIIAAQLGRISG